jgi:PAB-dependent poly(A)-specific ribonuclease subunit 3
MRCGASKVRSPIWGVPTNRPGFRLTNELAVRCIQQWKRIDNAAVVTVHDVFTTRAFGDSSLMCVSDYHPCSTTISDHHFSQSGVRVGADGRLQGFRAHGTHVPEQTIWSYMVQIASALKTIHSNQLAAQVLHPSKILITGKNRVRLGSCGIMDVVKFDAAQSGMQKSYAAEQQEDLIQLGKLMLSVASGSMSVYINPHKSLDGMSRTYSDRLRECITWLLTPPTTQPKDIDILLSEISGNAFTVLDNVMHALDTQDSTLATSLEDGRIARLMMKINVILERPDEEPGRGWSDTGERYYIKLFRDYVFHAVDGSGRPNMDLGHILGCLNRLDVGSTENLQLGSRDGEAAFVVSYRDVKRAIEIAFNDLSAGAVSAPVPKRKLG